MNCDGSPDLAWTQQDLYIPQPSIVLLYCMSLYLMSVSYISRLYLYSSSVNKHVKKVEFIVFINYRNENNTVLLFNQYNINGYLVS